MITLVGPKKGDVCHCEAGGRHEEAYLAAGWKRLDDLSTNEIRTFAPGKLPPRAKPETLAALVTAALTGGEPLAQKLAARAGDEPVGMTSATAGTGTEQAGTDAKKG